MNNLLLIKSRFIKEEYLPLKKLTNSKNEKGFSLPELMIVLLILAILATLALPQIISSQRMFRYSGMKRQLVASVRNARQEAMSQRTPVTFRFDKRNWQTIIYGGSFGNLGDGKNLVTEMSGTGLDSNDLRYGIPGGVPNNPLGDGTTLTALSSQMVEVTFQADGSVVDASNNPSDTALFFFHQDYQKDTAFAVSILGAGGRVKLWRYNQQTRTYVE